MLTTHYPDSPAIAAIAFDASQNSGPVFIEYAGEAQTYEYANWPSTPLRFSLEEGDMLARTINRLRRDSSDYIRCHAGHCEAVLHRPEPEVLRLSSNPHARLALF